MGVLRTCNNCAAWDLNFIMLELGFGDIGTRQVQNNILFCIERRLHGLDVTDLLQVCGGDVLTLPAA